MSARSRKLIFTLLLLALFAAGCAAPRGRMPDTASLDSTLKPGLSTKADVLNTLGPPAGFGMARVDYVPDPRVVWFYEAVGTRYQKVDLKLLLVFFNGDKYDGYMWFSSSSKMELHGS